MKRWVEKWLEIGYECRRDGERIPLRSWCAWVLVYRFGI